MLFQSTNAMRGWLVAGVMSLLLTSSVMAAIVKDGFAHDLLETAVASPEGLPASEVDRVWDEVLTDPAVLHHLSGSDLFAIYIAVTPSLGSERRSQLAGLFFKAGFEGEGDKILDAPLGLRLMLYGWLRVISGDSLDQEAQADIEPWVDRYLDENTSASQVLADVDALVASIPRSDTRVYSALLNHLNPFWHEAIRAEIDDAACIFYRCTLKDSERDRYYAGTFLLSQAADTTPLRARLFARTASSQEPVLASDLLAWSTIHRAQTVNRLGQVTYIQRRPEAELKADRDRLLGLIEPHISDESSAGDLRARWAISRGFVEETTAMGPNALASEQWLSRALGLAKSPGTQAQVVKALAWRLALVRQYTQALELLKHHTDVLADDPAAQKILADVTTEIQGLQKQHADWQQGKDYARQHDLIVSRLKRTRSRLKRALAQGQSSEMIADLDRAMADLKSQLNRLEAPSSQ